MQSDKAHKQLLKFPLFCFAVVCITAIYLVGTSYYFEYMAIEKLKMYRQRLANITQSYLAIDEQEAWIGEYYDAFINAYKQGWLGSEDRLSWIEVLQAADAEIKLPALDYEISSQKPFEPQFDFTNNEVFSLYVSDMKINLGLLHEGDLVVFLDYLDQHAKGMYFISNCKLDANPYIHQSINTANINAACTLHWLILKPLASSVEI